MSMAKLDVNYLDQIRQTFYSRQSAPNRSFKGKKSVKKQNEEPYMITFNQKDAKKSTSNRRDKDLVSKKEQESGESITNRVSTSFRSSISNETVSMISEKLRPSLSNSCPSEDLGIKKNARKRLLSFGSPNVTVKRIKNAKKPGLKLNFGDNTSTFKFLSQEKRKYNEKKNKKKLGNDSATLKNNEYNINCETVVSSFKNPNLNEEIKPSDRIREKCLRINPLAELNEATCNFDTMENHEENSSVNTKTANEFKKTDNALLSFKNSKKIKKQKLKDVPPSRHKNQIKKNNLGVVYSKSSSSELALKGTTIESSDCIEEAADYYDNSKVKVTGLKFDRFCSLFPVSYNEKLQRPNTMFNIPRKHFQMSQDDDFEFCDSITCDTLDIEAEVNNPTVNLTQNGNDENQTSVDCTDPIVQDGYTDTITTERTNIEEQLMNDDDSEQSHATSSQNMIDTTQSPPKVISLKNGDKILVLEHCNQTVHFYGLCRLKVLNGKIEILGACLNRTSGERKAYSPRGTALLYIRNTSKLCTYDRIQLKALVPRSQLNEEEVNLTFQQHCAIILCKKLVEPYIDFIEEHISQKILPDIIHSGLRVMFELTGNWNKTLDSDIWEDVLENVSEESKVVICGGKAVGKSTFLRYSVNVLLRRFKKIRIVELDPGQSEFYPPGCVSVVTLNKDILGPNYTHLQPAHRAMLSHINMGYNVKQYIKLVKHLLESDMLIETLPTLINFPGFTQGISLDIAINTLKLLRPTLLVEIKSKIHSKNYRMDMTPDNVNNHILKIQILGFEQIYNECTLSYEYVKFNSLSESNEAWSMEARQAREICILSYFGKMMVGNARDITHFGIDMYCIKISALTISSHEGKTISALAINGSLVALCSPLCSPGLKESSVFKTYGYGFVRGVDLETDTLVLLTPESIETLENVTHLVLGSVTTPPSLIMSVSGVKGHIPYVNVGDLIDFGQLTKRSYLPPKK